MAKKTECRFGQGFEFRAADGDKPPRVAGYACVFDAETKIGDYFIEKIARGALDDVMDNDVVFLVDHRGQPLARTTSGTLKLTIDERGLFVETELDPSDPDVAALVPKLARGDLSKMSFAFRASVEKWDESGDIPVRTIEKIELLRDVSVVTFPAYEDTEIALRSLEEYRAAQTPKSSVTARRAKMEMQLRLHEAG